MSDDKDNPITPHVVSGGFGVEEVSDPCDELHVVVLSNEIDVRVNFCQPVSWWTMPPEQALLFAEAITRAAHFSLTLQQQEAGITH